ncbi:hypothetical protein C6341_g25573 [Phytophthora cactorum]|nr:hypothetical protein C6341_g25573 [Phytophthora cactorum]
MWCAHSPANVAATFVFAVAARDWIQTRPFSSANGSSE